MLKFTITGNSKDIRTIENGTFQRISIGMFVGASNSTPDFSKIKVKCMLTRSGKTIVICNDDALKLVTLTQHFNAANDVALDPASNQTLVAGSGATGDYVYNAVIDFGTPINVSGSDTCIIDISHETGTFGSATASGCNITYTIRDTIGNAVAIPQITFKQCQTGQSNYSDSVGNNVTLIGFCSNSTTAYGVSSTRLCTNMRVDADKITLDEDASAMVARRLSSFETLSNANNRKQSFVIPFEVPVDRCNINFSLNSANITATNSWIGVIQLVHDEETVNRAMARHERHSKQNMSKFQ